MTGTANRWTLGFAAALSPLAFAAPAAAADAAPSACQMQTVGEMKVTMNGNRPTIPASINGQPVSLLIDTGSANNMLLRAQAARLGVAGVELEGVETIGVGGRSAVNNAVIKELKFAGVTVPNVYMLVTGESGSLGRDDIAGLLGAALFSRFDVEFDLADGVIRVFQPKNCRNDVLAYWGGPFSVAPMLGSPSVYAEYKIEVLLNGAKMTAQLDSGATTSVVTKDGAVRAKVRTNDAGVQSDGKSSGLGKEKVSTWVAVFDTFQAGDETIKNAKIQIADLFGASAEVETGSRIAARPQDTPSMLLGADFFRSHRVLISNSQRRVYFSYKGGPVFQTWGAPAATAKP